LGKSNANRRQPAIRLTQPRAMKTRNYVYGVEPLDGNAAWKLFQAEATGDFAGAKKLLARDVRLVNAQCWYQFPIHFAVYAGDATMVRLLLDHGADAGQSRFLCNSWDRLLNAARERGYDDIAAILERTLKQRFRYDPEFDILKEAIRSRNVAKVRAVLRRRPELIKAADALGNNALHWCVSTRQLEMIDHFASAGTPIGAQRADGRTPLLLGLHWYHQQQPRESLRNRWIIVGDLLSRGAEYTLSVAAAVGDQEQVERLLDKDPSLATKLDSSRIHPISYAAREGHLHIVKLLLERGASPNGPEDLAPDGLALYWTCCGNHYEIAELLLKHGANANAGVDSCECCLTICRRYNGSSAAKLQRLLRRHGAVTPPYAMTTAQMKQALRNGDPVIRDEEFLARLLSRRDLELLDLLLQADTDVVKNMHAYSGVAYPRSSALLKKLLTNGLDPNRPDWLGKTFLHACAENADRTAAAIFLDAGADINARDLEYKGTPLAAAVRRFEPDADEATRERRLRMIRFLLKHGATTELPDDEPWTTPLAWAKRRGLSDIAKVLQSVSSVDC